MEPIPGKTLVLGALRAAGRLRKDARQGKRLTFERHVAPVYRWVEAAHDDYVTGFRATRKAILSASDPGEVIEFLRDIRRGALAARGKALIKIEQMLEDDRHNARSLPAGWNSVKRFYESAYAYLYGATQPAAVSWYSDYIRFVEISAKRFPDDCWNQKVFGNDARNDLLFGIERALDRIEISFREVTQQYVLAERDLVG